MRAPWLLAALLVLAACTEDPVDSGPPREITRGPEPPLRLEGLPTGFEAMNERSGDGSARFVLEAPAGPHYRVLAKCEGGGELSVGDAHAPGPFRVPCDGETHRQQVSIGEIDISLRVKSTAGGRWLVVLGEES